MAPRLSPEKRAILTKEFLFHQYHTLKKSTYKISKEFKLCSPRTVYWYLQHYQIPTRTQKDSQKFRDQGDKNNPHYKHGQTKVQYYCIDCGKPVSDYRKKRCNVCNNKGKRCSWYGKPPAHGKHFKYKGYNLRSSYELKFAIHLDEQKILWTYEPKAFPLSDGRTYTPDFYLIKENLWIEVKGYWRDDAKEKFDLFKKEYPQCTIELVTKSMLQKWGLI